VVTHQLQVERRTAKERWPETDVLRQNHADHVLRGCMSIAISLYTVSPTLSVVCSSSTAAGVNYRVHAGDLPENEVLQVKQCSDNGLM